MTDLSPGVLGGSRGCIAHQMLELGEDLRDRVEIGAGSGQEDQMSANGADGNSGRLALVRAKIVRGHDIFLCARGRAPCGYRL